MSNNYNSQMPPNQQNEQVPSHRVDEMLEQMKQLQAQNQQLRQLIDQTARPNTQQPKSAFNPEVEAALRQFVQQELNPMAEQMRQQVGMLYEATDEANYKLKYSDPKFSQYNDKVEKLRQEQQRQGRWVPREEALKMVYFEETGKKAPAAAQAPAPQQPVFDPYFNAMVDPATGKPVSMSAPQPGAEEGQQQNWQQQGQQQPPQYQQQPPAWQQPQQQQQQAPQNYQPQPTGFQRPPSGYSAHPYANPYGQPPQLPNQGVNSQMPSDQSQRGAPQALSLESSDADLEAFANRFGDVPL